MKALVLKEPGDEPKLALVDAPDPVPGPRDVVVQVAACGFCHHDVAVMAGVLRRGVKPDIVLGHEISGTVVDVGADVERVKPGDFVGCFASKVTKHTRRSPCSRQRLIFASVTT